MVEKREYQPRLIAWEVTSRCPLSCRHCRARATDDERCDELSFFEITKTIDAISQSFSPILILTGGEPLLRDDIFEIISYGKHKGLRMVMATCGMGITDEVVQKLKSSGIERVSVSLDGATEKEHDTFRQTSGSFQSVIAAAGLLRTNGLDFQINTTVHKDNITQLPAILARAIELGAVAFHPFLLVPTGRAQHLKELELSPTAYESTLQWIADQDVAFPIQFKPTCAPHYKRIVQQKGRSVTPGKGCMGGEAFSFISATGDVQICGFLDLSAGNLREHNYAFEEIWNHSVFLDQIRDRTLYKGKCGVCEYGVMCGGCRARAYAMSGDYLGEEPFCTYQPTTEKIEQRR